MSVFNSSVCYYLFLFSTVNLIVFLEDCFEISSIEMDLKHFLSRNVLCMIALLRRSEHKILRLNLF
jgi:hypothetical protein